MITKAQKFRLGIFIIVLSILMIIFIVLIIGTRFMEKHDTYYINYRDVSVSGLQVGSSVKYHGIEIGRVEDIQIDREDVQNVIVTINVREGTPIKEDVKATLTAVGITGMVQIELFGGTAEADLLEPGSDITPGISMFASITGTAEIIAEKLEVVLNNIGELTSFENRRRFDNILANLDEVVESNKENVNSMVANLDITVANVAEISISANRAMERFDEIINSEQIDNILVNTDHVTTQLAKADLEKLVEDMNSAIVQTEMAFKQIDLTMLRARPDLLYSLESLRETMEYINEFSRLITEDPSVLWRSRRQQ
jgi:phospholipid/cholesterol/gamma-HCH transport system substrate-binding protein